LRAPFRLAVKDNIATVSRTPTTCASPILSTYFSPFEATVVQQLRVRGAMLVGKTNMDEFGMGSHSTYSAKGPVSSGPDSFATSTKPKAEDGASETKWSVGGSSGGSAVAVAVSDADVALGTDTGGSVRLPAAYTGVVGYKPSYGMLSRHGVVPYANSLDTVGLLARNISDIAPLVVGAGGLYSEHDPKDPTSLSKFTRKRCGAERRGYGDKEFKPRSLSGMRFGIPLDYNIEELDPRIRAAWASAASRLRELGAFITPVRLPSTRHALSAYYVLAPAEASSNLAKYDGVRYGGRSPFRPSEAAPAAPANGEGEDVLYARARGVGLGDEARRRIVLGSYTLSAAAMDNYFVQAQRVRRLVRRDFDRVFALPNPLLPESERTFDLVDMPEDVELEDKWGPEEVDFLLCPTAPTTPPALDDVLSQQKNPLDAYMNDVFTVPASLAGLPAVSVPVRLPREEGKAEAEEKDGRPDWAGLQLIGQFWDDARLLAVADSVSEALSAVLGNVGSAQDPRGAHSWLADEK
jgi:aspartyl-tRNA(Asn)/glutamyl-tRNA(Gln) amidotransferase subunit A